MSAPLLEVNDLKKHFYVGSGLFGANRACVYAVDGVSFNIDRGETLSLVGESGCGKSTIGRCILRLFDITAGQVNLDGRRIDDMSSAGLRPLRRRMQVVFQDPFRASIQGCGSEIFSPSRSGILGWLGRRVKSEHESERSSTKFGYRATRHGVG